MSDEYLTDMEKHVLNLERRLRQQPKRSPLPFWLFVLFIVGVCLFLGGRAWAAAGDLCGVNNGDSYCFSVASNSCADVLSGMNAYASSNGWSQREVSCSADPVGVGTVIRSDYAAPYDHWDVVSITATASSGGGSSGSGTDPVFAGMPATIGPVDHISFAYGVMAVCFAIGFGIGVRF